MNSLQFPPMPADFSNAEKALYEKACRDIKQHHFQFFDLTHKLSCELRSLGSLYSPEIEKVMTYLVEQNVIIGWNVHLVLNFVQVLFTVSDEVSPPQSYVWPEWRGLVKEI